MGKKQQPEVNIETNVSVTNDVKVTNHKSSGVGSTLIVAVLVGGLLMSAVSTGGDDGSVSQTVNVYGSVDDFGQPITCPPTCGLYVTPEPQAHQPAPALLQPVVNVFPQSVQEIEANREMFVTVVALVVLCLLAAFAFIVGSRRSQLKREFERSDWEIIDRGGS